MYCMVIHSCAVDDGDNTIYELIDRDGCSKDPTALEDLIYMNDLTAGIESAVFKFADKPHVYFNCQVQLSLKQENQGECPVNKRKTIDSKNGNGFGISMS